MVSIWICIQFSRVVKSKFLFGPLFRRSLINHYGNLYFLISHNVFKASFLKSGNIFVNGLTIVGDYLVLKLSIAVLDFLNGCGVVEDMGDLKYLVVN